MKFEQALNSRFLNQKPDIMPITIRHMLDALNQVMAQLEASAGADPFISQENLDTLLHALDEEEKAFTTSMYELAKSRKNNRGGRVTRKAVASLAPYLKEVVMPEFYLKAGPIDRRAARRILALGEPYLSLANTWKAFAEYNMDRSPAELAEHIGELSEGISLGYYANAGQEPILPLHVPAQLELLDEHAFFNTLENAPGHAFEGLRENYRLDRFVDGNDILSQLPGFQDNPGARDKASQLAVIMQHHLREIALAILFRNEQSFNPLFVAGITEAGHLVGFSAAVRWK